MHIVGFGDPVLDFISNVSHETLHSLGMQPGGCDTISKEELERLLSIPELQLGMLRYSSSCLSLMLCS